MDLKSYLTHPLPTCLTLLYTTLPLTHHVTAFLLFFDYCHQLHFKALPCSSTWHAVTLASYAAGSFIIQTLVHISYLLKVSFFDCPINNTYFTQSPSYSLAYHLAWFFSLTFIILWKYLNHLEIKLPYAYTWKYKL